MNDKWDDSSDGEFSQLYVNAVDTGAIVATASARQPDSRKRNWQTSIVLRNEGQGLSLASSKVDAVMALRRDATRLVEALGGKIVWKEGK
jgi:hypothetical protein